MLVYTDIFLKNSGERERSVLIETDLTESQLQKEIDKIEKEPGAENYTIDDILEKLEQRESITLLIFDCYEIEM